MMSKIKRRTKSKIKESNVGAYVEQLTLKWISKSGLGIPIAIKDNIKLKIKVFICSSNILKGYISI